MKKLFVSLALVCLLAFALSSCSSTRKTGCPMTEGIIH
jgi:hypothetical protein